MKIGKLLTVLVPLLAVTLSVPTVSVQAVRKEAAPDAEKASLAVRRAVPLIQRSGQLWLDRAACTSCHHQSLAFVALKICKDNGFQIDNAAFDRQTAESNKRRFRDTQPMYELAGAINGVSGHGYKLLEMAAWDTPPNDFTEAASFYLIGMQSEKGHWPSSSHRPPLEDSAFTLTATSIRALRVYPRGDEGQTAIGRARQWLVQAPTRSSEDRAMKLFGLVWSHASAEQIGLARKAILREQQPDGGWSQVPGGPSDAYATGQALMALRASGNFPTHSKAFVRGARFLIDKQHSDGSWQVRTRRVVSGLPYFETGFPHGIDQFISMAGTAWATMALAVYAADGHTSALTHVPQPPHRRTSLRFAREAADEPLFQAILYGTNRDVQSALKRGANANARSVSGTLPLILAVRYPDMIKTLLDAGADPKLTSDKGATALSIASATRGAFPSVKLLLAGQADPNIGNPNVGNTAETKAPLIAATRTYQPERLSLLMEKGANAIQNAFFTACALEDLTTIDLLIRKGADINKENEEYGGNAVNDAVISRNATLVKLLLEHGGNPNIIDKEGFSTLQVAASGDPEDSQIVALLLKAGANIDYATKERPKAVVLAAKRGNKVSEALLQAAMQKGTAHAR